MKKLIKLVLMCLPILFCSCSKKEVQASSVQVRNGLYYAVGEEKPLTATIIEKYESGQQKLEIEIVEGEKVGIEKTWYENGQLREDNLTGKDGSISLKKYWDNGSLQFEKKLDANGDGEETKYLISGEKKYYTPYKGGLEHGELIMWHPYSGEVLRNTYEYGKRVK